MALLRQTTCDVQTLRNVQGRAFKTSNPFTKYFRSTPTPSSSLPPSFLQTISGRGPDPPVRWQYHAAFQRKIVYQTFPAPSSGAIWLPHTVKDGTCEQNVQNKDKASKKTFLSRYLLVWVCFFNHFSRFTYKKIPQRVHSVRSSFSRHSFPNNPSRFARLQCVLLLLSPLLVSVLMGFSFLFFFSLFFLFFFTGSNQLLMKTLEDLGILKGSVRSPE